MDPHRLPTTISSVADAQNNENENNQTRDSNTNQIQDNTHIPAVEPFLYAGSQAQLQDIHMDYGEYDRMPELQEVSDSESESDRDAHEVEMQAVDSGDDNDDERVPNMIDIDTHHHVLPRPSSSNPQPTTIYDAPRRPNHNRRPRVVDDEDEERDRRHPSQRVSSANNNAASAISSFPQLFAHLPQNQPHVPPTSAPVPPAQTQRQTPHIHHHIFHATLNVPRQTGDNNQPFRFFQHMMPNNNNTGNPASQSDTNPNPINNDNNNPTPAATEPPQQQQDRNNTPQLFEGIALSFEIGPGFRNPLSPATPDMPPHPPAPAGEQPQGTPDANGQLPPPNQPPRAGAFADLMAQFGAIGQAINGGIHFGGDNMGIPINVNFGNLGLGLGMQQEKEDPERARKLVDRLEEVPIGLVRRLERVGGTGGGMGEDISNGGDAGCAICWDKLLDGDGEGFGKKEKAAATGDNPNDEASSSSKSETNRPNIVSLPCAHVFHADCLIPWFSRPRHTTCPTCRFNIDPDNLTYVSARRRQREQAAAARPANGGIPADDGQPPAPEEPANNNNNTAANNDSDLPFRPFTIPLDFAAAEAQENQFGDLLNRLSAQMGQAPPAVAAGATPPPPTPAPGTAPATAPAPPPRGPGLSSTTIQTPHGTVNVIQVPIPIVIPVQVPAGPAGPSAQGGAAAANGNGSTPTGNPGDAPAQPQPGSEVHQGPGGEFAQLLSRIMRQETQQPVPFNSLFPAPFFHLGGQQPQAAQDASQPANAVNPAGAAPEPGPQAPPPRIVMDPAMLVRDLPRGFSFQPQPPNPMPTPGAAAGGNDNHTNQPNPDAPGNQRPPNIRAEVMRITLDMVFNGPMPAPLQPAAQGPAAAGVRDNGAAADDELMMMIEETNNTGDDDLHQMRNLDEVLDLLAADEREQAERQTNNNNGAGGNVNPAQPQPTQTTVPPSQQQRPQQLNNLPPFLGGFNAGRGIHVATGSGRTVSEAFSQLFAGMRPPQQAQQSPADQPQPGQERTQANAPQPMPQEQQVPSTAGAPPPMPNMRMFPSFADLFRAGLYDQEERERPKRAWTLPPAPGPTLRQRIERREREAGLRCYDVSCGIGPSDEDPFGTELGEAASGVVKQLAIRSQEDRSELCAHRFHSSCLVSAERVALRGADAIVEDEQVEVSCPVCRSVGCVSKEEWEEGVVALA